MNFPAMAAGKCLDYQVPMGGLDVGDVAVVRPLPGNEWPAGTIVQAGAVSTAATLDLRICNVSSAAIGASGPIAIRWYGIAP